MPNRISIKVGRSARTGRFVTVRAAQRNPITTVVETITVRRPKRRSALDERKKSR
ncbi:MAG TPA: hypothetical protein VII75_01190 [Thermoanaerobaculia bacterium]